MVLSALRSLSPVWIAVIALFLAVLVQVVMTVGRRGATAVFRRGKDAQAVGERLDKTRAAANLILSLGVLVVVVVAIGVSRNGTVTESGPRGRRASLDQGLTPAIEDLQSLVWHQGYRDSTSRGQIIDAIAQLKAYMLEDAYDRLSSVRSEGISVVLYDVNVWVDGPTYRAEQEFTLRLTRGREHRLEVPIVRSMQLRSANDLGTGIEVGARSPRGKWASVPNSVKTFGQEKDNVCYVSCNLRGFGREGDSVMVTIRYRGEQAAPFSLGDTDIRSFSGEIDRLKVCYHFLRSPSVLEAGQLNLIPAPTVALRPWREGEGGWRSDYRPALPWPDDFAELGWSNRDQFLWEYARTRPSIAETPILFFWQEPPPDGSSSSGSMASVKRYH